MNKHAQKCRIINLAMFFSHFSDQITETRSKIKVIFFVKLTLTYCSQKLKRKLVNT